MDVEHVLVPDHCDRFWSNAESARELFEHSPPDVDLQGGEQHVFGVLDHSRGYLLVQRPPLVEQTPELILVTRKRASGVTDALPCTGDVDVDPERERIAQKQLARAFGEHRPTPQGNHRRCRRGESFPNDLFLQPPELRLAAAEELGDGTVSTLELTIAVDERPAAEGRDFLADRRFARAHETHEREMTFERAYRGDQSIRSR
jgi:hypothetical protein